MKKSSKLIERYLQSQVRADLRRKMVFIGGPRQVGKTTLAKRILADKGEYFNWDVREHRKMILRGEFPESSRVVFDEIHKHKQWRNYLKGLYDLKHETLQILVTGSARLDYYRFGGDSLQGRYHILRLHPLSVAELKVETTDDFRDLLTLGGFPEPFFSASEREAKRWSQEYRGRLIEDDLRSLERVDDLGQIELLMLRLPELVGSPLSINALREDLQVSHKTLSRWLTIFERLYAVFRLAPFGAPKIRAVKKERKHYHFDWSLVPDEPARFENMVASHLLKWVHFERDTKGRELDLRYFRDVDRREVDFVVVENKRPILFVESKWADTPVDQGLLYMKTRFPGAKAWQVSAVGKKDYVTREDIRVAPAIKFLKEFV